MTDKINYAMLDLAVVILFSIGFIRILIRFCSRFSPHGFGFCFVLAFTQNKNRSLACSFESISTSTEKNLLDSSLE